MVVLLARSANRMYASTNIVYYENMYVGIGVQRKKGPKSTDASHKPNSSPNPS
jgi:hypothetical protein